jgi:calcineurin-like phosphoesterase family protein
MGKIWLTSDLHLGHDKEFIWKARGFESVEEMNLAIVGRFNSKVQPEDTVYILGDLMLGDNTTGEYFLSQLNGKKIFIRGNHDTNPRVEIYKKYTDAEIKWAEVIKYKGKNIYLSHYPTLTSNQGELHNVTFNFFGHTHQKVDFFDTYINMYHVGVDSHDCYPVLIDDAIAACKDMIQEYKNTQEIKEI